MIITALLLVAFGGAVISYFRAARAVALATVLSLATLGAYSATTFSTQGGHSFEEQAAWIPQLGITYHLGVDGISYPFLLLTILLAVIVVLVSRREIHTQEGAYYATLLLLIGGIIGVFASLDLVLLFVFWEVVLVSTFMLILVWGAENRRFAAMKFLLYTGAGSAALLLAIILLAVNGVHDITALTSLILSRELLIALFLLVLLAVFIKMPIVPFHTWLPDAHVQAPTAGSILLAGVMLKMGGYLLLRFMPLFSALQANFILFWVGVATVLWGAWVCLEQTNLKRLIAYSSINHMGLVLVAIAAGTTLGTTGAIFEMISHGLIAAMLFGLAGVIHQQAGTFDINVLHGLAQRMPKSGWLFVIAALAGLGLPGMTGFIAEFIVFLAALDRFGLWMIVPLGGMILTGAYFLRLLAKAVFGSGRLQANEQGVSFLPFGILLAIIILLGSLPFLLLRFIIP
jgi:proton-translocating NADH-quinone oxidoreductase chain M